MNKVILHKLLLGILALIVIIAILLFLLIALLTNPVPTSVSALSIDLPVESVQVPMEENSLVRGWLSYGEPGKGVILLAHSMRSNRVEMLSRARFLRDRGYTTLMIDLHAHGETPGEKITFGSRESENVLAAAKYLRKKFPQERIGALGASLGGAAIILAKPHLLFDAVILESVHATLEEAINNRLKLHLGEYGSLLSPIVLFQFSFFLDVPITELDPISQITHLNAPVFFISGTDDAHTTPSEVERMYTTAIEPKELWIVPGAKHFNMHTYAGKMYEERITEFFEFYLQNH
ncbi:esterase [Nitrosomonas sp. PY1]|uniref:alpha/beta hydrolase n=1 Tax=Nitrosomonas sp. PY1 TaxID=1803906 RepID=UPI001FC83A76|nr:prolyl oligopeptidase family serine peptidase [Nitrosomonas sp. PY1]GKS68714.1 esterase [Nitrosomonas sp. PY1]